MKKFSPFIIIVVILGILAIVFFGSAMFKTLQPGERAVVFKKFTIGLDKERIFTPGFHIIAPWNTLHVYNVKEQSREETMDVLDKNGLSINVDVTVRFNPVYEQVGFLHERFGKDYINQLVIPELRSTVRQVMGRFSAEEIYSKNRQEVEENIITGSRQILERNYIDMRALLIRSINLPDNMKQAIENKLQQEQEALAYQYRLQREESEAERLRIEAEGKANANQIINSSLTPELLKMRGIEATQKLADSENAKVVVIGGGEDGLPLILGNN